MPPFSIKPYTDDDAPKIGTLLAHAKYVPFVSAGGASHSSRVSLSIGRAHDRLANRRTSAWIATTGRGVEGLIALTRLPWDTQHLGLDAARIECIVTRNASDHDLDMCGALIEEVTRAAMASGIQHITARCDAADFSSIHALERAGYILTDGILTFSIDTTHHRGSHPSPGVIIRMGGLDDAEGAVELARTAYTHSRFHADPVIPDSAACSIYADWVRNSFDGRAADTVVVAEVDGAVVGFVTCRLEPDTPTHLGYLQGHIPLVAVDANQRGRRIGQAMTQYAVGWFHKQGAERVEVGTQLCNIPAGRLYESAGFRLVSTSISLRWANGIDNR